MKYFLLIILLNIILLNIILFYFVNYLYLYYLMFKTQLTVLLFNIDTWENYFKKIF